MAAKTYIKNPDGSFSPAPSLPVSDSVVSFVKAAASEVDPALIHGALTTLGSQVPSVIPVGIAATTAMSPEALNAVTGVLQSAISGNPVAIAGSVITAALFAYTTFSKTQIKGITDDQITTYVNNLSRDELISRLSGKSATVSGDPASPTATIGGIAGSGSS